MADAGKEQPDAEKEAQCKEEKTEPAPLPPPEPEKAAMYSVWAIPHHYDPTLHLAMTQLRETFEGPAFGPHVTVLGAHSALKSDAEKSLKALCAATLPYTLKVKKVACGNNYHQCVYLLIDPTQEVVDAHMEALACFGQLKEGSNTKEIRERYMPHISLLYGHMTDEELNLANAKVEAEHGKILIGKEYNVTHLTLYLTDVADESCVSWKKVAEYPLRAPDKPVWAE